MNSKNYFISLCILLFFLPGCKNSDINGPVISDFLMLNATNTSALLKDATGTIKNTTITVTVPRGTDATSLIPTITVSDGATILPASGTEQDFTNPVNYTLTAEDGTTTSEYTVTVQKDNSYLHTVLIEKGTFSMGDSAFTDADVIHDVTLSKNYYMSLYEITYNVWYKVKTATSGYTFNSDGSEGSGLGSTPGAPPDGIRQPAGSLSWRDAIVWCNALSEAEGYTPAYYVDEEFTTAYTDATTAFDNNNTNWNANGYRLPTEAEWEYAAREGGTRAGSNYSGADYDTDETNWPIAKTVAWFTENTGPSYKSFGVGLKLQNSFGLYDMSGNIMEFIYDWDSTDYTSGAVTDPTGPLTGTERGLRGGQYGWSASALRTSRRAFIAPSSVVSNNGFRVVRNQ